MRRLRRWRNEPRSAVGIPARARRPRASAPAHSRFWSGYFATGATRAARGATQVRGRALRSVQARSATCNEKAPDHAGALTFQIGIRSVLGDDRAAPVEAVDQRGADGLGPGLESDRIARQSPSGAAKGITRSESRRQRNTVVEARAVF